MNNQAHGRRNWSVFLDLAVYLSVMLMVREIYFPQYHFMANGLFWSFTTLLVATLLLKLRGVGWQSLGLGWPTNLKRSALSTVFILIATIASILVYQQLKTQLGIDVGADRSNEQAVSKFGDLAGNWHLFFALMPFIWLQSVLEEILDRGFLISWIEKALANHWFATVIAVLFQAVIFGFRHSHDLSDRSITVGLIGLAMGLGYVLFGRNLWPLIVAHCLLNTMSILDRV